MSAEDMQEYVGRCVVGCGFGDEDRSAHPPACERHAGGKARAVTEPDLQRAQFWAYVIHPFNHGVLSRDAVRTNDEFRDGVRLTAEIFDDAAQFKWQEVTFNLTAGEARQLAATLIAAADSHDQIDQTHHLLNRIEKLGDTLRYANIDGA